MHVYCKSNVDFASFTSPSASEICVVIKDSDVKFFVGKDQWFHGSVYRPQCWRAYTARAGSSLHETAQDDC